MDARYKKDHRTTILKVMKYEILDILSIFSIMDEKKNFKL